MSTLEIENLRIAYGNYVAVNGIDLTIKHGELVSLLGPSGSGKTSVLRAVGGYLTPSSGAIKVDGRDITRDPPQVRDMGMVFQNFLLFPHMSVQDNVEFGLRMRQVPKTERRQRAMNALDMVQMAPYAARLPYQLSGGQQQRVALARALVIRPTILLMDEPMGALDAKLRAEAQEEIRTVQREVGVTTILVTHDQQEAMAMSDRIVVMREGAILEEGEPHQLYREPRTAFTAEFLGTTTLLPVDVLESEGGRCRVRHAPSGHEFLAAGAIVAGQAANVSLRPEHVAVSPQPSAGSIAGRVVQRMFYGVNTFLRVDTTEAGSLLALEAPGTAMDEGAGVYVSWRPEDARVLPRDAS
ncbi:MAG: ABC transporter ATP-binding protein [Proteobacteria bacterium]|nr:ABC transporter ATP-binding protein [Pseudomonadota bacterium]